MKKLQLLLLLAIVVIFTKCDPLKTIPAGDGSFTSLSGNWRLISSSDGNAMEGTVIKVVSASANATVVNPGTNNRYCVKENDVFWKVIKPGETGTFTLETLVNACSGKTVYRPATISAREVNEIQIDGFTEEGNKMVQTYQRMPAP